MHMPCTHHHVPPLHACPCLSCPVLAGTAVVISIVGRLAGSNEVGLGGNTITLTGTMDNPTGINSVTEVWINTVQGNQGSATACTGVAVTSNSITCLVPRQSAAATYFVWVRTMGQTSNTDKTIAYGEWVLSDWLLASSTFAEEGTCMGAEQLA